MFVYLLPETKKYTRRMKINDIKTLNKFKRFLKQNKAYAALKLNCAAYLRRHKYYSVYVGVTKPLYVHTANAHVIFGIDNKKDMIDYLFLWKETPQGHDFWSDLCHEWHKYT